MRWAERILKRDKVCAICESIATEAHHIYTSKAWPELRLDRNNGIGLCSPCHRSIYGREDEMVSVFFLMRPQQDKELQLKMPSVIRHRQAKAVALRKRSNGYKEGKCYCGIALHCPIHS